MVTAYIALGSNLGDRHGYLRRAVDGIARWEATGLLAQSPVYDTDPVGGPAGQPVFLNQVIGIKTGFSAAAVLAGLQALEAQAGRDALGARIKDGPRTLDLDLLVYGDAVIDEPGLTVPHPRMHERLFVLEPFNDIAPALVIPGRRQTVSELLIGLTGRRRLR